MPHITSTFLLNQSIAALRSAHQHKLADLVETMMMRQPIIPAEMRRGGQSARMEVDLSPADIEAIRDALQHIERANPRDQRASAALLAWEPDDPS